MNRTAFGNKAESVILKMLVERWASSPVDRTHE